MSKLSQRIDKGNGISITKACLLQGSFKVAFNFFNRTVRLNGKVLKLVDDHTFPDLNPLIVPGDKPLILPPLTFGFYVIPGASASGCMDTC